MNALKNAAERLAVCSWSLQPISPQDLAAKLLATGIRRVQFALDPLRTIPALWNRAPDIFREQDISIVSGMFGCVGEDYSTLETIKRTGGIAPDPTWEQNLKNIQATAALAQQLALKLVTFHAGFLPHDEKDPGFAKMLGRLGEVADIFWSAGISLGLETGQETAPALLQLLEKLQRKNVGVNFDPANMILYGKGEPVAALRQLGPWIFQVHIKDARRTQVPGTWGEELPAGSGEVDWPGFFTALRTAGYQGDFVIEREAGTDRVSDIRHAKEVVEKNIC